MNSEGFDSIIIDANELTREPNESQYQKYVREQMETTQQIQFHSENILMVKNRLGSKCTYLSWQRYGDNYGIKAVINGKEMEVALGGTPKDVGYEEYQELFKTLNDDGENK